MRRTFYLLIAVVMVSYLFRYWLRPQAVSQPSSAAPRKRIAPMLMKDSLTVLDGIGPAYERALNALGILTFADLAAQDADTLASRLSTVRVTAARIRRDRWIEQAAERNESLLRESRYWSANDGNKT
jgi:predicted flap endonuclease-1-like 5' DNA nuclease